MSAPRASVLFLLCRWDARAVEKPRVGCARRTSQLQARERGEDGGGDPGSHLKDETGAKGGGEAPCSGPRPPPGARPAVGCELCLSVEFQRGAPTVPRQRASG